VSGILSILQGTSLGVHITFQGWVIVFIVAMVVIDAELTIFIAARLIYFRRRIRNSSNPNNNILEHPDALLIWLQSALLNVTVGLALLCTTLARSDLAILFLVIIGQVNVSHTLLLDCANFEWLRCCT